MDENEEYPEPIVDPTYLRYLEEERQIKRQPIKRLFRMIGTPEQRTALPQINQNGVKYSAVYGIHSGRAIHGPVHMEQFFPNWNSIGTEYQRISDKSRPLSDRHIETINRNGYFFDSYLSGGSEGQVWKAYRYEPIYMLGMNIGFRKEYLACKVISLRGSKTSSVWGSVKEIMNEINVLKLLGSHPNLCSIKREFYLSDSETDFNPIFICIFMELCDDNLESLIQQTSEERLPECYAHKWFVQISQCIKYMHDLNTTHSDITTYNILYKIPEGSEYLDDIIYKLSDFGFSKIFAADEDLIYGVAKGFAYNINEKRVAKNRDIESLARCLVRSMITINETSDGTEPEKIIDELSNYPNHSLDDLVGGSEWSQAVCHLIHMMTTDNMDMRYDIDQVLLHEWVTNEPIDDLQIE